MKNIITYSVFQLFKGKRITLITLAMIVTSFCTMGYTVFDYYAIRAGEFYAKKVIPYASDEIYRIDVSKYILCFEGGVLEHINQFYKQVKTIDGLKYCGLYGVDNEEKRIDVYGDVLEIFGMDLESYRAYGDNTTDSRACVWIGENRLGEYKAGDEYIFDMYERCKVAGVIEGNNKILSGSFYQYGELIDLDDMVIVQMDNLPDADLYFQSYLNDFYFCISKDANAEEIKKAIYDIAKEFDIDVNGIISLEKIYDSVEKELVDQAGESYLLPIVMMVSAMIGLIISSMISIKTNKRDNGIMIANGMSVKDVSCIYIFENIIKIGIAVIASYGYCIYMVKDEYERYFEIFKMAQMVYILITVLVLLISNIAVVMYFRNKIPCELIGGAHD